MRLIPSSNFYRPQRSWGKVMFLHVSVILLTGGVSASVHAGIHHPPWKQTPTPGADTSPGADTPGADTPGADTPLEETPPGAVHAGRHGQQAGGTHPTGMHTCLTKIFPLIEC